MVIVNCPVEACQWKSDDLPVELAAVLGQQLQMHDKSKHTNTTPHQEKSHKLKINPPKMGVGASPEDWKSFKRQWEMYKTGTDIKGTQTSIALFHCCSDELKQDVMRDLQINIALMPEGDLLAEIKRLAVKDESILVHRMKLGKMTQAPGMGIRTYLANLRGQASLCSFTVKCTEPDCLHTFDFSQEIIKDNLIRGISDPEIQADLLGDAKTDRTLDEVVTFFVQKQQGKATRSAVGDCTAAINWQGKAKTTQSQIKQKYPDNKGKCWACAGPSHGPRNDKMTRTKFCPAWSATCNKCNIKGHYNKSCSRCNTCGNWGHNDNSSRFCKQQGHSKQSKQSFFKVEDELYSGSDQLAAITPVEHHIYKDKWIPRPSKPHPTVTAKLTPLPDEHTQFGHNKPKSHLNPVTITMIADSGCQSSIMPLATAESMGYKERDIMPVTLSMRGAIHEDLEVEGGIVIDITVNDETGKPRSSKQFVYLSKKMTKAFLCREALEQLGIIHKDFPKIKVEQTTFFSAEATPTTTTCSCPQRTQDPPPIPTSLPDGLKGNDEDVPKLKEWLLNYYGGSTFNTCEHQPLPMMTGEPLKLYIDPDAKPTAVHKPSVVPIHWQEKVLADLERDVALGVLEKVGQNNPVTWCSRMVVTAKSDGTPRRTVDLQPQNKNSVRQTHHTSTPFRLAEQIPQNKKKTVTDAWNGYHSVPLCEEDRHITTFITPWGRYRYKVAPQGFLSSGDGYTQRFDSIIAEFKDKVKCVDDTCMWSDSVKAAFFQTCDWLDLCARNNVTLNPKKFQFAQDTVEFGGLTVTSNNIKPSQKFLKSILEFPTPKDITGARAWFGLINQGAYAFSMAKDMRPFRDLLKSSIKFEWTDELNTAFERSKLEIVKAMKEGVKLFEPSRPTCLSTDWSNDGIGFTLRQKYCQCKKTSPSCCSTGWHLCLVGSRFTTETESRYAPIEGEALAVAYALHQTRYYILGCPELLVATDHKPLLQILNDRSLNDITNRRLLNLKEKTLPYSFTIQHVTGAKNKGPDALSRYPPPTSTKQHSENLADDIGMKTEATGTLYVASNIVSWEMVKTATEGDETLKALKYTLQTGMPNIQDLDQSLKPFHRYADHLYVIDGVVMLGQRIIIPISLQGQLLKALHAAHQGIGIMNQRAADSIFWPGISVDISRTRNECEDCHRIAKSNAMEPPPDISLPEYPFQQICSDYLTHLSSNYLVMVDRYSNWPIVFKESGTSTNLVKRLRDVFITFGIPEELTSDGGPQFTAEETQEFLKSWGVHHRRSSVGNPHANARAEIAVKSVKRMLMANTSPTGSLDVDAFQKAILIFRNSIDPQTKTSPAMIVFGRQIRDPIPTPLGRYCPHPTWQETIENREKALAKRHNLEREKWEEHTKELKPLEIGDHVYLQNLTGNHPLRWEKTGVILEIKPFKQYMVKTDGTGRITLRNRKHLRKFTPFVKKPSNLTPLIIREKIDKKVTTPNVTPLVKQNQEQPIVDIEMTAGIPNIIPHQAKTPQRENRTEMEMITPTQEPLMETEVPQMETEVPQRENENPDTSVKKLPLALRRLLPTNKPGRLESLSDLKYINHY